MGFKLWKALEGVISWTYACARGACARMRTHTRYRYFVVMGGLLLSIFRYFVVMGGLLLFELDAQRG